MNLQLRQEIKRRYDSCMLELIAGERLDPYPFGDWTHLLTHIENNVWADIRYWGLPFFPQFPIKNYFVDFADPKNKICIEVDGKQHSQQKEKDLERQKEIEKLGWKIIRIEGKNTFHCLQQEEWENAIDEERNSERIECPCSFCLLWELKKTVYAIFSTDNAMENNSPKQI